MENKFNKPLDELTQPELIYLIETMRSDFTMWRCSKCGHFSQKGHICYNCRYDPS